LTGKVSTTKVLILLPNSNGFSGAKETPYEKTPDRIGVFECGEDVISKKFFILVFIHNIV
jgi:hypothetical protein